MFYTNEHITLILFLLIPLQYISILKMVVVLFVLLEILVFLRQFRIYVLLKNNIDDLKTLF